MAIAFRILDEIFLMVLLRRIKAFQRRFLDNQRLVVFLLNLSIDFFYDCLIVGIIPIYSCSVSCTYVSALTVQKKRIDGTEKETAKRCKRDHLLIINHLDTLYMSGLVSIDFLIGRIRYASVRISDGSLNHSVKLTHVMLCAPETSSC